MNYLIFTCILCLYWFLLSGHTSILLLTLGLASVILVVWLVRRMDRNDNAPFRMLFKMEFFSYLGWLFWQVIITNIDVARRIWDPSLPIKPACRKIKVSIKDPLIKTIYANSITLTPGTVTLDLSGEELKIHALSKEAAEDLQTGKMAKAVPDNDDLVS